MTFQVGDEGGMTEDVLQKVSNKYILIVVIHNE